MKKQKLQNSAGTTDPVIFTESIFPQVFGEAAMESYTESQESYESLFQDKNKYNAILNALAGTIYRDLRKLWENSQKQ
jgi:type I restriction enzyme R subunit